MNKLARTWGRASVRRSQYGARAHVASGPTRPRQTHVPQQIAAVLMLVSQRGAEPPLYAPVAPPFAAFRRAAVPLSRAAPPFVVHPDPTAPSPAFARILRMSSAEPHSPHQTRRSTPPTDGSPLPCRHGTDLGDRPAPSPATPRAQLRASHQGPLPKAERPPASPGFVGSWALSSRTPALRHRSVNVKRGNPSKIEDKCDSKVAEAGKWSLG